MSSYYPQQWKEIHTYAVHATTPQKKARYCQYLRRLSQSLPCGTCRAHFKAYLESNPPENAEDPFVWSWEFHNNVNHRLQKPILDIITARSLYE